MSDNFLSQKAKCENVKDIQVITQRFGSYIFVGFSHWNFGSL